MKAARLVAACLLVVGGAFVFACSSSTTKSTTGGGKFFLSVAPGTTAGACPDPNKEVVVSVKSEDGSGDKLIVEGSTGATVRCNYDDSRFDVAVSNEAGGIVASGTFANATSSKDADITLQLPGAPYKSDGPCSVTFDAKSDGNLTGHFTCPTVFNSNIGADRKCAVTALATDGSSRSFFKFTNCAGF